MPLATVVLVNTGVRWHLFQDHAIAELHLLTGPEASHSPDLHTVLKLHTGRELQTVWKLHTVLEFHTPVSQPVDHCRAAGQTQMLCW